MAKFDPVWDSLTSREQICVLNLLIQRIDFDGEQGDVAVTFHPHEVTAAHAAIFLRGECCLTQARFCAKSVETIHMTLRKLKSVVGSCP